MTWAGPNTKPKATTGLMCPTRIQQLNNNPLSLSTRPPLDQRNPKNLKTLDSISGERERGEFNGEIVEVEEEEEAADPEERDRGALLRQEGGGQAQGARGRPQRPKAPHPRAQEQT